MAWQIYKRNDMRELAEFLKTEEWGHVGFSSRIAAGDDQPFTVYINRDSAPEDTITEAILYTNSGLLIPVLTAPSQEQRRDLAKLLGCDTGNITSSLPAKLRRLHSIMGLDRDVRRIQEILPVQSHTALDYHTMTREGPVPDIPCVGSVECKVARPRDAKSLYPLQMAYEIEEVLLNPNRFNPRSCLLSLQRSLRRELVMYAKKKGTVIAKAGTNARGFCYAQLGGVYTVESYRNQGVGECIIGALLSRLEVDGLKSSLFVKKTNLAAIKLYRKLSFDMQGAFRIAYYR